MSSLTYIVEQRKTADNQYGGRQHRILNKGQIHKIASFQLSQI